MDAPNNHNHAQQSKHNVKRCRFFNLSTSINLYFLL
eukprot:UN05721